MKRFKNILYVLDANKPSHDDTLERVATLARLNDATVNIVSVEENSLVEELGKTLGGRFHELVLDSEKQTRETVNQLLAAKQWQGVKVSGSVLRGKGFIAIIQKVLRDGHDLIIKEETLERGIDQLAMRLVRKCPCPVWIIKRGSRDFKRILGALDIAANHPETKALNRKIIELTHSLAQREQGEAHFLHSWRLEYEIMLSGPRFKISLQEIAEMKNSIRVQRADAFEALFESVSITPNKKHIHLREGQSNDVIKQILDELAIDVIIMGSVARSGIPGLLIGNRAEELFSSIQCTVLTVKPDNFVSPVTFS